MQIIAQQLYSNLDLMITISITSILLDKYDLYSLVTGSLLNVKILLFSPHIYTKSMQYQHILTHSAQMATHCHINTIQHGLQSFSKTCLSLTLCSEVEIKNEFLLHTQWSYLVHLSLSRQIIAELS